MPLKSRFSASDYSLSENAQCYFESNLTRTMEDDHRVTSHLIPELLHEFIEIVTEALNRSISFFENILTESFPCPKDAFSASCDAVGLAHKHLSSLNNG